jgi:nucleoside-diphosphate-sugar epimerase
MPNILITGARSFVGTNFIKYSQFREIDQVSLLQTKPENIDFEKYGVVLHLAAIVHQVKKIPDSDYFKVNRDLCLNVARCAKKAGVKQFIFLSTLKVYGKVPSDGKFVNENSECFPEDAYGRSKLAAEIGLRNLESKNFVVSIIRTPLVYGEGVKANMKSLIRLIEKYPVLPFRDTHNKRNFTYTENLVGFIDQIILKKASGTFITMDENAVSTTELVTFISESLNKKIRLFSLPDSFIKFFSKIIPEIFDRLYSSLEVDNRMTKSVLGYNPPFSTEEGVRRMISSYKKEKINQPEKIK